MTIMQTAETLNAAILSSDMYGEYKAIQAKILQNADLTTKIKNFQEQKLVYNAQMIEGGAADKNLEDWIGKIYFELNMEDDVRRFFEAEKTLFETITAAQNKICEGLELLI